MLCQKILIIFDYTGLYPRPCWRCYTLKRVKLVNERGEELRFYNGMWPSKAQPLSIMFYSLVFNFSCWIFLSMPWAALTLTSWKADKKKIISDLYYIALANRRPRLGDFLLTDGWILKGCDKRWSEQWACLLCRCYLCLIPSASVCDHGSGNWNFTFYYLIRQIKICPN